MGSFDVVRRIRSGSGFVLDAAFAGDRPVVVVHGAPSQERDQVRTALAAVRDVHDRMRHRLVPRVVSADLDCDDPWLCFDCPATFDGGTLLERMATSERRIPYAGADAFIRSLREGLEAGHAAGTCMGRISPRNVLFAPDGRFWLIGFGRNLAIELADGVLDTDVPFFQAPELAVGGSPSPTGDYVALVFFMRAVMPWADMKAGPLGRIMRGDVTEDDAEIVSCMQWIEQNVVGALHWQRASIREAVAVNDRIREICGVVPDETLFHRHVCVLLHEAPLDGPVLLARDGSWIEHGGVRTKLGRAPARIALALALAATGEEAPPVGVEELVAAGWPGERVLPEAGATRVYTAVAALRRAGLEVQRSVGGYRVAPGSVRRM